MKSVLVTGLMGSGKTSVADRLISKYGFTKVSMANWIKSTVIKHYKLSNIDKSMIINGKSMRTILQEVGMYMRNVDPDWHLDEVLNEIDKINQFVIDDLRFTNELNKITNKFDCITIKVTCDENKRIERMMLRDSVIPTESQLKDLSESEIDNIPCDYIIVNNGTLDELFYKLDEINEIIERENNENAKR